MATVTHCLIEDPARAVGRWLIAELEKRRRTPVLEI